MKLAIYALLLTTPFALCTIGSAIAQTPSGDKKPDRWEAEIRKFEQHDRASPPPTNAVLFVGSSSIRLWDLNSSFPDLTVINRGFGGSQIADAVHFADRIVTPYRPRLIVFYAGDNDLAEGKSPETVAGDFAQFVKHVRSKLPDTSIVYISIKPSAARWKLWHQAQRANELINQQAEADERIKFLDIGPLLLGDDGMPDNELFQADRLHLNAKGYERWTKALRPLLLEKPKS